MPENSTSNFVVPAEQPGREFEKTEQRSYELIIKEIEERRKAWMERWEKFMTSGQSSSYDYETRLAHLEKEVEELKEDKLAKDVIIGELLLRISKLEVLQNLANRM